MERKLRTCCVCGTEYRYCPKCNEDKDKPRWMFVYHSENCKDIYDVMTEYEWGQIDADEAAKKLKKLDLSKLDDFGESYKNTLNKIMSNVSKTKVEEPVVENVTTEEVKETEVSENDEIPKRQRAKRVKTDVE